MLFLLLDCCRSLCKGHSARILLRRRRLTTIQVRLLSLWVQATRSSVGLSKYGLLLLLLRWLLLLLQHGGSLGKRHIRILRRPSRIGWWTEIVGRRRCWQLWCCKLSNATTGGIWRGWRWSCSSAAHRVNGLSSHHVVGCRCIRWCRRISRSSRHVASLLLLLLPHVWWKCITWVSTHGTSELARAVHGNGQQTLTTATERLNLTCSVKIFASFKPNQR